MASANGDGPLIRLTAPGGIGLIDVGCRWSSPTAAPSFGCDVGKTSWFEGIANGEQKWATKAWQTPGQAHVLRCVR